ncbi:hypothetical protein [Candidatus Magnetobacterium casense]|uniref:Secreted protein n=1 Tax=Candidatus Magnetobacterium casense TaxID=1455061 RepID=A0ABS6RXE6_9BACT|nr:hypothetical protein [Candidatus Magnetobacterium casensis]MBV6341035.1 hypothetical protein [Candidatus Magnetobacterium casensis]
MKVKHAIATSVLLILALVFILMGLTGCAFNKIAAVRVCADKADVSIEGTPIVISGEGVNAIVVYNSFWTLEKGRQVPPLCDIYSSEKGSGDTKDNTVSITNPDVVTRKAGM